MCHIFQARARLSSLFTLAIIALLLILLDLFLVLIHLLSLLVHHLLEQLLHLLVELLHLPRQHLQDLPPHVGDVLPRARKASWTSLLKVYLLASICVARTLRRSVSIEGTWMKNSLSLRGGKRKSWPRLIFLTLQFVSLGISHSS